MFHAVHACESVLMKINIWSLWRFKEAVMYLLTVKHPACYCCTAVSNMCCDRPSFFCEELVSVEGLGVVGRRCWGGG